MNNKSSKSGSIFLITLLAIVTLAITFVLFNLKGKCGQGPLISHDILGQFGDFYGGVLGTIITIFGLFYIYRTFQVQSTQLDIAKKDADLVIVNKLYSEILEEINNIQYRRKVKDDDGKYIEEKEKLFLGIDALYNFDESHWHSPNSVLNHLTSIIVSFDQLIFMVENKFKFKHKETKDILLTKIYFLFYSKIIWPVFQEIYRYRKANLIEKKHGDAPFLFTNYKRLTKKAYKYLLDGGHVGRPHESDREMIKIIDE